MTCVCLNDGIFSQKTYLKNLENFVYLENLFENRFAKLLCQSKGERVRAQFVVLYFSQNNLLRFDWKSTPVTCF